MSRTEVHNPHVMMNLCDRPRHEQLREKGCSTCCSQKFQRKLERRRTKEKRAWRLEEQDAG